MEPLSRPSQEPPTTPSLHGPPHSKAETQMSGLPPMAKLAAKNRARRRAREVSSRYMTSTPSHGAPLSPASSFPNSGDTHLASAGDTCLAAAHKHPARTLPSLPLPKKRRPDPVPDAESSSCFADENQPAVAANARRYETPLQLGSQRKAIGTEMRRAVRLFGDNGVEEPLPPPRQKVLDRSKLTDATPGLRIPRTGTPVVDRVSAGWTSTTSPSSSSRALRPGSLERITAQVGIRPGLLTPARGPPPPPSEDDRSSGWSENSSAEASEAGVLCDSPVLGQRRSMRRAVSNFRASTVGSDLLPPMYARRPSAQDSSHRLSSSLCLRSLSFGLSSLQQPPFNPTESVSRPLLVSSKFFSSSAQAPKPGIDSRKARKGSNSLEDMHSLRLLHNCHHQWRFINAEAQAAVHARTVASQKSLLGICNGITELRDSVALKRVELERLQRARRLQAIVQAQMPYLDEWTNIEGDHTNSLSEAAKALQDASLRLPITGDTRVDIVGISEVFESAVNMVEESSSCVGKFLPKAEGVENIVLDLVKVIIREKVLIEECGDLLSVGHGLQVKECSLRSQLIQLKQTRLK